MYPSKLVFITILLLTTYTLTSDLAVTGLIEIPAESSENFNWSSIEIILMTKEGKIIERANPTNNGFYLMPVYQKRDFDLHVRSNNSNFNFEPSTYPIPIKNASDSEIEELFSKKSYNFKLAGVMSKGRVFVKSLTGRSVSYDNIKVTLWRDNKMINSSL